MKHERDAGVRAEQTFAGVEVEAYPESRVDNSQPHGIGRVVALDGLWAWNNLGRNVVFAGDDFRPRAVFDESVFADDEPSQYDLDVHAILDVPSAGIIVTLNHLGMLRAFSGARHPATGAAASCHSSVDANVRPRRGTRGRRRRPRRRVAPA